MHPPRTICTSRRRDAAFRNWHCTASASASTLRPDATTPKLLPLAGLAGAAFLAQLGATGLNVALPNLASAFSVPSSHVSAVVVIYLVTTTAGLLVAGPLGDRIGRRRTLLAGLTIFVVASAFAAVASTLPIVIAARALQGIGGSAMAAMSIALVIDAFPRAQAGATLGVLSTTSALATMLGPSLGGLIVGAFGWRAILAMNVPLGIIVVLFVAFGLVESTATSRSAALFDRALVRNPRLLAGLATSTLVAAVMIVILTVGPFVLAKDMGLSIAAIGFVMACGPLVSVVLAVPAGRIADRVGARTTTIWALSCFTAGSAFLAVVIEGHSLIAYVLAVVVLSVGYSMFQTPNSAAVMAEAPAHRRATVSGLLTLSRNIGFIAGAGGLGALYAASNATTVFVASTVIGAAALAIAALPSTRVPVNG